MTALGEGRAVEPLTNRFILRQDMYNNKYLRDLSVLTEANRGLAGCDVRGT
jgi:hypothetical protein